MVLKLFPQKLGNCNLLSALSDHFLCLPFFPGKDHMHVDCMTFFIHTMYCCCLFGIRQRIFLAYVISDRHMLTIINAHNEDFSKLQ